jgi:hypothetical protein
MTLLRFLLDPDAFSNLVASDPWGCCAQAKALRPVARLRATAPECIRDPVTRLEQLRRLGWATVRNLPGDERPAA